MVWRHRRQMRELRQSMAEIVARRAELSRAAAGVSEAASSQINAKLLRSQANLLSQSQRALASSMSVARTTSAQRSHGRSSGPWSPSSPPAPRDPNKSAGRGLLAGCLGERELMPALLRLDHEAVGPKTLLERCALDDYEHRIPCGVVPAAGYAPQGPTVGQAGRRIERRVDVPLTDVVFPTVASVVLVVEIALQERRVAREREGPMSRAWSGWTGTRDLKRRVVRRTPEQDASGLASRDRARVTRERGPDRRRYQYVFIHRR